MKTKKNDLSQKRLHRKAIRHISNKCPKLAKVIKKVEFNFEPDSSLSPFASLARAIVFQQLSGKAASTIFGRFKKIFKNKRFPTPQDVLDTPSEKIRAAGLSRAKTFAIKDLALKVQQGVVPTNRELRGMKDEEIIERLVKIRGIGRWSVEMFLIFRLGRLDVFSATDYGVRKGFAKLYDREVLPTPKEILEHAERWKPYRTIATWYFWRCLEV